ncbi:stage VI sporulation protein D [Gracilibacillus halotolerans]|uniref:Stage VI sporulation protein D n=1 Tax=Gracilibacillus halotolerans TaxID=74386 RepID=A0A841RK18_9BACI|nr:stage VI sporulation protein D [Gracilibacillus halotolerans]MBB6511973.1 stage VI sporulation protein D [Gracilibacillus halotolerans]
MTEAYVFELNETIYFDRENEIEEMLGVGLEPVITVEETGDVISVRGVLELQGEYRKKKEANNEIIIESSFVDRVEPLSEDLNEFFHRFMLDISLSNEKVRNINDVVIEVSHFDYQLPSSERMEIEAKLEIQGLVPFRMETSEIQEEHDLPLATVDEEINDEEREQFSFELNHNDDQVSQSFKPPTSFQPDFTEREIPNVFEVEANQQMPEQETEGKVSEEMVEHRDEEIQGEEIDDNEREEVINEEILEDEMETNQQVVELVQDISEEEELDERAEDLEEDEQENSEEIVTVHGKSEKRDDASYLMNIFKQEGEEDRTKLTIYIAQPEDSLNEIAEKYKISTSKLARINRLDDDWVANGQILYIPKKSK